MKDNNDLQNFLSIKSKTWTRDSHGLFDYESNTVRENVLIIQKQSQLIRKKHDIKELEIKREEAPIEEVYDQLVCDVKIKNSKFY